MKNISSNLSRIFVLLITLAALALTSCGTLIPTQEPVALTFGFPIVDKAYYESLLVDFKQQNPNITITFKTYQDNPREFTDVVIIPWTLAPDSSQAEALLPLDPYITQEEDFQVEDFYPNVMEAFKINGEQIAVPSGVDPWVMFYNKDLFDKYAVPYPQEGWDWTDFLALAEAVRHSEDTVYGYSSVQGYTDSVLFLYQHGGALGDGSGNPTLNSIENVEALEWYTSLFHDYQVAPTTEQAQDDFGYANYATTFGLINGKIGMVMGQFSTRGGRSIYPSAWTFKWGAVPLPHDVQDFTGAFYEGIGIMKESKNPDAAWKWASYLSRQPHNRLVPARISLANSPEYAELVGEDVAKVGRDSMANAMVVTTQNIGGYAIFMDEYFRTVDILVNTDANVQEELEKLQIQAESQVQ
jgi:ABC-type glycerol-3-phosphate transport system substrate-binding protein